MIVRSFIQDTIGWELTEAYWVPPNPLTVWGWTPNPLMLGGWIQPFIWTFLPKTGFQDIFLIHVSYDAQEAYYAKRSSLRCYSTVPTLSPDILMNSHRNSATWSLLGGRFNNSIRLWELTKNFLWQSGTDWSNSPISTFMTSVIKNLFIF